MACPYGDFFTASPALGPEDPLVGGSPSDGERAGKMYVQRAGFGWGSEHLLSPQNFLSSAKSLRFGVAVFQDFDGFAEFIVLGSFFRFLVGGWVYAWTAVMRLRVGRALMVFPASCWAMRSS
jgi:hypothetical protein